MSTIVTRTVKGSPLTWLEADANFDNLNTDKLEASDVGNSAALDVGTTAGTVAAGDHTHTGVYEPADATILKDADIGVTVGYPDIPPVGQKTSSYSIATADVGKYVEVGSGGSITIPDATFSAGDVVGVFNNTSGNITITCSITTAYIAGTDSDKATMTLATRGLATILFISGTVCVVQGNVS